MSMKAVALHLWCGLSALMLCASNTWGGAPGWYGAAPLALKIEGKQKAAQVERSVAQVERWAAAQVRPQDRIRADKAAYLFSRLAPRYEAISQMRNPGAPAVILFCLHQRESGGDFSCHPHEGSPLTHRTRDVPKGRLPHPEPPYTFAQSAEDAYYVCDKLDRPEWTDCTTALQAIEAFNGTGYQRFHPNVPSPYLWAATTLYSRGKYTGDGRFDPLAVDRQLGCAAMLKAMERHGIILPFEGGASRGE